MNLRNADIYDIGLDLGTGSVGWSVTDESGSLLHIKGKPTWGARIFPSAETAADTRLARSQRRRYDRRRQRIQTLQELFAPEMEITDPEFFIRLRQARLLQEDRNTSFETDYRYPLFNSTDFTEGMYYRRFPTIWHLRKFLMESDEKADIRLIYLAFHNIVKCRGNFLREDQGTSLSARNANMGLSLQRLESALIDRAEQCEWENPIFQIDEASAAFKNRKRGDVCDALQAACGGLAKPIAKAIAGACLGYNVEIADALGVDRVEGDGTSHFTLDNEDKTEAYECPDEASSLFLALQDVHSSYVLNELLSYAPGETISSQFVKQYQQHGDELEQLKQFVKGVIPSQYSRLFRGPRFSNGDYDFNAIKKSGTKSYTAYILGDHLCSHEELIKELKTTLSKIPMDKRDETFDAIEARLDEDGTNYLEKQKTRSNGAIPYQLHLEEMDEIIEMQGKFYPFLRENKELLDKIVSSRIPYYVGPLNTSHDLGGSYPQNPADPTRKFGWAKRKPGMDHVKLYPWNVDEVIDKDETAERFIKRMTGTCTYLYGEDVLPKHSLVYESFCVLNELNNVSVSLDGERAHRLDPVDKRKIYDEVFRDQHRKTIKTQRIVDWFHKNRPFNDIKVYGTQKEDAFASSLGSNADFCKILNVNELNATQQTMVEELIEWCTLFEDRKILKHKIEEKYGDVLSCEQIGQVTKKRYEGWGRLSERFLEGIRTDACAGRRMSIMDILYEGNPRSNARSVNLMEILTDKELGFQEQIDLINQSKKGGLSVEDLPGSPANRRTVNQAMRIVQELVSTAGKAPRRICIEVTRDDDEKKKGKRTVAREKRVRDAYEVFKGEAGQAGLLSELKDEAGNLDKERYMLYFLQRGKSLYSNRPININELSSGRYHVDHILPQAYIKDDSLDNKALVFADENERKLDSLLLDDSIINRMSSTWKALHDAGLMSDKKFNRLRNREIGDKQLTGFINRQLVETGQIVKFVRQLMEQQYPDTIVASVRASVSSGIRENADIPKCRSLNDYHHAQDAYLATQVARYVSICLPDLEDGARVLRVRKWIEEQNGGDIRKAARYGRSGFVADGFMQTHRDSEGNGEILWDANEELGRMQKELWYKDCFISRMPEVHAGAFWDKQPLSPKSNAKLIPLKKGLDTSKYGGYTTERMAYFCAFVAKDKKGKWQGFIEGVPLSVAERKKTGNELFDYITEIASRKKCGDVHILRSAIPYYQLIECNACLTYLTGVATAGAREVKPANQIALDASQVRVLNHLFSSPEDCDPADILRLFDSMSRAIRTQCPRLISQVPLDSYRNSFAKSSPIVQANVIAGIVDIAKGTKSILDLSQLKDDNGVAGKKSVGHMLPSLGGMIDTIVLVDHSVTGIFERKTALKDIVDGL